MSCGLRLPAIGGRVASLRRGWMRRFGWYPGDWVWVGLPTLAVAVAAGAVAIALTRDDGEPGGATIVAASTRLTPTGARPAGAATPAALPTAPEPGAPATRTTTTPRASSAGPNGRLSWPATVDGWTIVLISYPVTRGRGTPLATAKRAAGLGLPEVGVLQSSDFSSLHPGYAIVFSGIYSSRADAEAALPSARATGFGTAYTRQISR